MDASSSRDFKQAGRFTTSSIARLGPGGLVNLGYHKSVDKLIGSAVTDQREGGRQDYAEEKRSNQHF
jgi:hypothetical protein